MKATIRLALTKEAWAFSRVDEPPYYCCHLIIHTTREKGEKPTIILRQRLVGKSDVWNASQRTPEQMNADNVIGDIVSDYSSVACKPLAVTMEEETRFVTASLFVRAGNPREKKIKNTGALPLAVAVTKIDGSGSFRAFLRNGAADNKPAITLGVFVVTIGSGPVSTYDIMLDPEIIEISKQQARFDETMRESYRALKNDDVRFPGHKMDAWPSIAGPRLTRKLTAMIASVNKIDARVPLHVFLAELALCGVDPETIAPVSLVKTAQSIVLERAASLIPVMHDAKKKAWLSSYDKYYKDKTGPAADFSCLEKMIAAATGTVRVLAMGDYTDDARPVEHDGVLAWTGDDCDLHGNTRAAMNSGDCSAFAAAAIDVHRAIVNCAPSESLHDVHPCGVELYTLLRLILSLYHPIYTANNGIARGETGSGSADAGTDFGHVTCVLLPMCYVPEIVRDYTPLHIAPRGSYESSVDGSNRTLVFDECHFFSEALCITGSCLIDATADLVSVTTLTRDNQPIYRASNSHIDLLRKKLRAEPRDYVEHRFAEGDKMYDKARDMIFPMFLSASTEREMERGNIASMRETTTQDVHVHFQLVPAENEPIGVDMSEILRCSANVRAVPIMKKPLNMETLMSMIGLGNRVLVPYPPIEVPDFKTNGRRLQTMKETAACLRGCGVPIIQTDRFYRVKGITYTSKLEPFGRICSIYWTHIEVDKKAAFELIRECTHGCQAMFVFGDGNNWWLRILFPTPRSASSVRRHAF